MFRTYPSLLNQQINLAEQIFFGTPHNTHDLTSWEDTLLSIFLSFWPHTGSPIPKNLATRAGSLAIFLQSLADQFRSISSRRSLISVYEQPDLGSTDQAAGSGLIYETGIPRKVGFHRLSWFSGDEETLAVASAIMSTIKAGKPYLMYK
jgi:hypothetical protein